MDSQQFLQRPGGLGPTVQKLQPLGGVASTPGAYQVLPENIEFRRATQLDDINRVMTQFQKDRGDYSRSAVGPTNYQIGNIMSSQEMTGVAAYNQGSRTVFPLKPADMNYADYMVAEQNTMKPYLRQQLQLQTVYPQQNFYSKQDISTSAFTQDYRMGDSLQFNGAMKMEKPGE